MALAIREFEAIILSAKWTVRQHRTSSHHFRSRRTEHANTTDGSQAAKAAWVRRAYRQGDGTEQEQSPCPCPSGKVTGSFEPECPVNVLSAKKLNRFQLGGLTENCLLSGTYAGAG